MIYDLASSAFDYPERDGRPLRSMLVCTYQRSGSTLLGEAMYAAGGFGCPLEYYHRGFSDGGERWQADDAASLTRNLYRYRTDPTGTLGAKLMWPDVARIADAYDPSLAAALRHRPEETSGETYKQAYALLLDIFPDPHWISLRRSDMVRQAVSLFKAQRSGIWRGLEWSVGRDTPDPEYDFDALKRTLATVHNAQSHWQRFFDSAGIRAFSVSYEAMFTDFSATLKALFTDLGNPGAEIGQPRLRRQADSRSERLLLRFLHDLRDEQSLAG